MDSSMVPALSQITDKVRELILARKKEKKNKA